MCYYSQWCFIHRLSGLILLSFSVLPDTDMVIIYLSSGLTSRDGSEQEKRATLSTVKEENRHLNNSVMILTYALMNGTAQQPRRSTQRSHPQPQSLSY